MRYLKLRQVIRKSLRLFLLGCLFTIHNIRRFGDKTQTYSFAVHIIYRLIDRLIDRVWYLIFPQGISGKFCEVFMASTHCVAV